MHIDRFLPAVHTGKAAGAGLVLPPKAGRGLPGSNLVIGQRSLQARRSFLAQSTDLPPFCGPQGTGVTLGPNKGPSELLSASGWRGRGGARRPKWTRAVPHPARPAPSRKPPRWHCQGTPEDRPGCLGVGAALQPSSVPPSPRPTPAPPDPARAPPESAVFPIKAGIPGWAQTKRDRGKSTPRANQTLA